MTAVEHPAAGQERRAGLAGAHSELRRVLARAEIWALPGILLLAAALRIALWLAAHPLHHDEALYGSWAQRIAGGHDPLLLASWVDKPPLVLYLQAAALRWFGVSELALRLPGLIAGLLAIPILYGFARRAYDRPTALTAAALFAVCAFAVQFSATAFTDPWLVVWLLAAAWAALAGRAFWAGVALGLAVASKQQGLLGALPALALLAVSTGAAGGRFTIRRFVADALLPGLFGFALILVPLTYWDSLRWAKRPSFWDRSLATYGGLYVARPEEWGARAVAWAGPLRYLFGAPAATLAVFGLALWAAARAARQAVQRQMDPAARLDLLLFAGAAGFLAVHVVVAFQPWDRYLLPLAPVLALLAARGLRTAWAARPSANQGTNQRMAPFRAPIRLFVRYSLLALLALSALMAAGGRFPIGSDHGAYAGVDALAARLRALPPEDVIYYRSLGWHYDFYLFDAPQEQRWWDSGWKLADDAAKTAAAWPMRGQWVVLPPADQDAGEEIRFALATRGLALDAAHPLPLAEGAPGALILRIGAAPQAHLP